MAGTAGKLLITRVLYCQSSWGPDCRDWNGVWTPGSWVGDYWTPVSDRYENEKWAGASYLTR